MDASSGRAGRGGGAGDGKRAHGQSDEASRPLRVTMDDTIGVNEEGAGARGAGGGPGSRRVAVIVCHGMGQQVPFETIDGVASAIAPEPDEHDGAARSVETEQVATEDGVFLPRAEVRLPLPGGGTVTAHFYEAYWAPLTEGKVTLRDTLLFLLGAGWRGTRFAFGGGMFDRWMFGRRQEFAIPARRVVALLLAWCVVLLIAASSVAFPAIVAAAAARALGLGWPPIATVALLLSGGAWLVAGLLLLAAGGWLVARVVPGGARERVRTWYADRAELRTSAGPAQWGALVGTLLLIVAALGVASWGAWRVHASLLDGVPGAGSLERGTVAWWRYAGASGAAGVVALLLVVLRWFLVEFPGDVAAYVSSYKVSRFQEIRRQIQQTGRVVARYVYGAGRRSGDDPATAYDEVIFVGHSLGSVVAYDTLDDALNRDQHVHGWFTGSALGCYAVAARTSLLLTFGSPLDKTAFIFRTQKVRTKFDVREALATSMQPLISDYAHRPRRWINVWSRWDWVSGALNYYDEPPHASGDPAAAAHEAKRVVNVEAATRRLPGPAHTGYWEGALVPAVLRAALTRAAPRVDPRWVASGEDLERLERAFGVLAESEARGARGARRGEGGAARTG